jgi:hypothetical protein
MIREFCHQFKLNKENPKKALCTTDILFKMEVEIRRLKNVGGDEFSEILNQIDELYKDDDEHQEFIKRNEADSKLKGFLYKMSGGDIKLGGSDLHIFDGMNEVGIVDILFTSFKTTTNYLCQRKHRAQNDELLLEQMTKIVKIQQEKTPEFKIVSVFIAETTDENLFETLAQMVFLS